ncbi:alpha-ketoglutarate-dependent dioxygenase AlkB family protein [Embleya hyalina]|uniref:Alkylated DNA repair protein n=1 Tax=Embleya hyalina TaxID=516124 RepID=A0A401Z645_9ACTN|nr:alpha-ketoglutarate-dependent dioxygenase AlkB [Embleya hyalina]GCE02340.1 alkylated DNA repair protein [Embleya hyalina]
MTGELFPVPRERVELAPGAWHVPNWLSLDEQRELVVAARSWAAPPAGMRHVVMPSGGVMSVRTVCLGLHWEPYHYSEFLPDGTPVKPFPALLGALARRAVADVYGSVPPDPYDIGLVNHYDAGATMGLHRDADEASPAPVVSLSIGDRCVFRFGNTETRTRPWTDVDLHGGDLIAFGGPSRLAYHGVPRIRPTTGNPATGLAGGRLNITIRASGRRPSR